MKGRIADRLPWQLRKAALDCIQVPRRLALFNRRKGIRRSEGLVVSFGGVLDDGRPVHGGAVKLLALRGAMPCDENEFSVLYAVSSSQPEGAVDLLRLCRKRGIRIVWNQNGVGYPGWAGRESERFNEPMRKLRAMADFVVYQSRFCEESARHFLGPSNLPSQLLFNPVDTAFFYPLERPDRSRVLRLLCAGTHGTRDRVVNALEALALLRRGGLEGELTMAGSFQWQNGEADFKQTVEALGLSESVRRVSRFSQADATAMYQAHDILVHPKYMDPCPTVVLEAMACGLPVVGSASGGMSEMVEESCGVLVSAPLDWENLHTPSPEDLAMAVACVYEKLEPMSAAARRVALERFSVTSWVESHKRIFSALPKW
jgi:glycosyltransferase involved in cell wall biosynthesis